MIIKDKEMTELIKQQHEVYQKLDKSSNDEELQAELVEVTEQITNKTKEILVSLEANKDVAVEKVVEVQDNKPKNIKREMYLKYQEMIVLYREVVDLLNALVAIKKSMRDYMKKL